LFGFFTRIINTDDSPLFVSFYPRKKDGLMEKMRNQKRLHLKGEKIVPLKCYFENKHFYEEKIVQL
jgi:hypothetical protein